jgi:hypothetical protein
MESFSLQMHETRSTFGAAELNAFKRPIIHAVIKATKFLKATLYIWLSRAEK